MPVTTLRTYLGIYGDPDNEDYQWSDKSFWKEGKYEVEPFLRKNVLSGIRNPIYEGVDFSHARRVGNFDLSAGLNMFTDEGYKKQGYNKRFRAGGNLTYHQPMNDGNLLNYGFNVNYMSDKYADFFLWRSPKDVYEPSPIANMGREANTFYIDPFFNFTNPNKIHPTKSKPASIIAATILPTDRITMPPLRISSEIWGRMSMPSPGSYKMYRTAITACSIRSSSRLYRAT